MEHLGGLIHRMPLTAFTFLVGCVAISALPPLNGFVSEWLTFQAILLSPQLPPWGLKLLVPAVGALLALSAALAAACFVKAFGVTFLGRPRTAAAAQRARDRPLLARRDVRACRPLSPRRHLARLRHRCAGAGRQGLVGAQHAACRAACPGSRSCRSPRAAAPITACSSSSSSLLSALGRRCRHPSLRLATRCGAAPAWDCGYPDPSPATQYTAGSFAQPIRRVFGTLVFRAREHVEMPPPGDTRPARFTVALARPHLGRALRARSPRARRVIRRPAQPAAVPDHPPLSQPRLRRLVVLLLVLAIWP